MNTNQIFHSLEYWIREKLLALRGNVYFEWINTNNAICDLYVEPMYLKAFPYLDPSDGFYSMKYDLI